MEVLLTTWEVCSLQDSNHQVLFVKSVGEWKTCCLPGMSMTKQLDFLQVWIFGILHWQIGSTWLVMVGWSNGKSPSWIPTSSPGWSILPYKGKYFYVAKCLTPSKIQSMQNFCWFWLLPELLTLSNSEPRFNWDFITLATWEQNYIHFTFHFFAVANFVSGLTHTIILEPLDPDETHWD